MREMWCARRLALPVLMLLGLVVLAPRASALAGLAEHDRTYTYNRFANLVVVRPGDVCEGADKYCLLLVRPDGRRYRGAGGSLEAVSVPADVHSPYVLAQRSADGVWLVFDLGTDTVLVDSADMQGALDVWEELGQVAPELVDTGNAERYLDETRDSIMFRWGLQAVLMAMGALVPSLLLLVVFGGLARSLRRGYNDTGSRLRLMLARMLMVPATLAGIVLAACIGVLATMWVSSLL